MDICSACTKLAYGQNDCLFKEFAIWKVLIHLQESAFNQRQELKSLLIETLY